MTTTPPTRRQSLNDKQLQILYLLYKFRFGTTDLFASCQGDTSRRYLNTRLRILCEQGYIGRNYEADYKFRGQHASYFLLTDGIKVLKEKKGFKAKVLRNISRDKNASDRFITHSLHIFTLYCQFKRLYGDDLKFFTKSYLTTFNFFPEPLPDAYVSFKDNDSINFLMDYIETTTPFYVVQNRVEKLLTYADEVDWPEKIPFPTILFVCETERLRQRLASQIVKELEAAWVQGIVLATTTQAAIDSLITENQVIWQRPDKPKQMFDLKSLVVNP